MTNWDSLPKEVIVKILELVQFHEDFISFSSVCTCWRSAAKEAKFRAYVPNTKSLPWSPSSSLALLHDHHELPWLVIADEGRIDDDKCCPIYSLCRHSSSIHHLDLPYKQQQYRLLSSRGWLLFLTKDRDHKDWSVSLINPVYGTQIQLPLFEIIHALNGRFFEKFTLSGNPLSDDDYSVAVVIQKTGVYQSEIVATWKKGDKRWFQLGVINTHRNTPFLGLCSDIAVYKGEFYAVDNYGNVLAFGPGQSLPRLVVGFATQGTFSSCYGDYGKPKGNSWAYMFRTRKLFYLVESMGQLLLLCREKRLTDDPHYYKTVSFQVFELDVENKDFKQVHSLGDRAVFVGSNSSFSVKAFHGSKPNCIYYADDYRYQYYNLNSANKLFDSQGKDSGIYSLTTREVESSCYHASLCAPKRKSAHPMWLESPASSP